ncbi:MAG: ABC transporter substrate-binding protein [Marinilabiliaceae bacterium]|nr:ABC transporter substrate-binding protein [Marinilabiliaceae bacterium]
MKRKNCPRILFLYLIWIYSISAIANNELDTVVLQLKWKHQFQFAGFYAAVEQNYYREAGIEVILKEGLKGIDPIDEIISGRANFGIESPKLIIDKNNGQAIVALAAIFQHSPEILITLKESGITKPEDFISKRISISENGMFATKAIFNQSHITMDSLQLQHLESHTQKLISGDLDLVDAYITDSPFYVRQAGKEPVIFKPISYGIDFYGDILFTSQEEIENNIDRVTRFKEASEKGWIYAMSHKKEMVKLIREKYDPDLSAKQLSYEAMMMEELLLPKLVRPGQMNEDRWRHIADTYVELDLLQPDYTMEGFFLDDYKEAETQRMQLLFRILIFVVLTLITVSLISFTFNRKLRKAVLRRTDELSKINKNLLDEIKERKRILHSLSLSEERFKLLFEDAPISLWEEDFSEAKRIIDQIKGEGIQDLDTYFNAHPDVLLNCIQKIKIININQSTLKYFQANTKQEVIKNVDKIFLKEAFIILKEELVAFSQGKTLYEAESSHYTIKGERILVSISVKIPLGYKNSWKKVFVSLIDITELKQASNELQEKEVILLEQNEALRERNQKIKTINTELSIAKRKAEESDYLKTAFLSNMSHEIRTPMMGIVGFIDLLKMSEPNEEEHIRYLNIIEDNSQQLLSIISDIIDISKIEAGQLKIDKQQVDVYNIVDSLKEVFNLKLKIHAQKSIVLDVLLNEKLASPLLLSTDETRLRQILTNLLENAIKFTTSGHVKIGIKPRDNELLFYVSDTGKGIREERLTKIFDRFFKEDDQFGMNSGGTGLGLSIARSLVNLLGGEIWVESTPGKGSTFFFTHPL